MASCITMTIEFHVSGVHPSNCRGWERNSPSLHSERVFLKSTSEGHYPYLENSTFIFGFNLSSYKFKPLDLVMPLSVRLKSPVLSEIFPPYMYLRTIISDSKLLFFALLTSCFRRTSGTQYVRPLKGGLCFSSVLVQCLA